MTKHHDQGIEESISFEAHGSQGLAHDYQGEEMLEPKLRVRILSHKHQPKRANWEWGGLWNVKACP